MRKDSWLEEKMWWLLENYFADIPVRNNISIKFGRRAKQRLGSIRRKDGKRSSRQGLFGSLVLEFSGLGDSNPDSEITLTGYFKDEKIPEFVVISTIAHELVHYAHGFSSPLEQRFKNPHQGGIVRKELSARGLGLIHKKSERWLKENWGVYLRRFRR